MYARILVALAMAAVALPAGAPENTQYGPAPSDDVTFEVPIQLTQLAADIRQVDVTCILTSDAIVPSGPKHSSRQLAGHVVLDVSNGQLVTPATVVVVAVPASRLKDPDKHTFNWECSLTGYSVGTRETPAGWDTFAARHEKPSFQLSPAPTVLSGKFDW